MLSDRPVLEPAFEVLCDNLVERRLLRSASLVAAGRRGAAMQLASDSRGKPCDRGDHGQERAGHEAAAAAREGWKPTRPPYKWSDESGAAKRKSRGA